MRKLMIKMTMLVAIVITITSCSSNDDHQSQVIPKDAPVVMVIDQNAMKEKLKTGNYNMDSIMNNIIKSIDTSKGNKLVEEWNNSGIDMQGKMYFFVYEDKKATTPLSTSANFSFALKDSKKFETFLKNQSKSKTEEVKKGTNFSYIKIEDALFLSWNENVAMLSTNTNQLQSKFNPMTSRFREESLSNEKTIKLIEKFYNLKPEDKITSIKPFEEMFKKKADAYMFTSMNSLTKQLKDLPIQILKLDELLNDNYTVGLINFENGKVAFEASSYYNPKLTSLLNQYGNGSVKLSMLENFPAATTNGAMLFSFKPEMLEGLLKELQVDAFVESALESGKMGFTFKDVTACLKGDFGIAMGDFDMSYLKPEYNETTGEKPTQKLPMKFLFNAEVGDFKSLEKILAKAVEQKYLVNTNGVYSLATQFQSYMPIYLRMDNKNIIISDKEETYTAFASKAVKANFSKSFTSNLTGKNSIMYLNIESFLKPFIQIASNNIHSKNIMDKALTTFDEMSFSSDNVKDGKATGKGELKMKTDKENSLVSIANFIKTTVNEIEAMEKEQPKFDNGNIELSKEKLDSLKKLTEGL